MKEIGIYTDFLMSIPTSWCKREKRTPSHTKEELIEKLPRAEKTTYQAEKEKKPARLKKILEAESSRSHADEQALREVLHR